MRIDQQLVLVTTSSYVYQIGEQFEAEPAVQELPYFSASSLPWPYSSALEPDLAGSPRNEGVVGQLTPASGMPYALFYSTGAASATAKPQTMTATIQKPTSISIPLVSQGEIEAQYRELGDALGELVEVDEESDWAIEPEVYHFAVYTASVLMELAYPAPKMFTHGSKSVVFNWSDGTNNLYLTISSNALSALVSTPKRIERRLKFSSDQLGDSLVFLPAIRSAYLGKPSLLSTSSTDLLKP